MTLPATWAVSPVAVVAVVVAVLHEIGLRRLARRQTPAHRRRTRVRSVAFYLGLVGMALVASGPLQRWAMPWMSVHMVTHVLEMFYLPPLLLIGGPVVPLMFSLPVGPRRVVLRCYYRSGVLTGAVRFLTSPIVAVLLFNGVMVLWHIPAVYNWASYRAWAMPWLMNPSFIVTGLLFWRIILPTHPRPSRGSTAMQVAAIIATAFEMLVLALALAVFTKEPLYTMNIVMDGASRALSDQRIGAGILWICGDFWAIPALVLIAFRIYGQGGGVSESFERALGRV